MTLRWHILSAIAAGVAVLGGSALAQQWAFHWNEPYYWSGTNCRAICIAEGLPENGVLHTSVRSRMYIDDVLVVERQFIRPQDNAAEAVMFDSTVLTPWSDGEVRFEVDDSNGQTYSSTFTAVVANKASIWSRYDLELDPLTFNSTLNQYVVGGPEWNSLGIVAEYAGAMNYSLSTNCGLGWGATVFCESIQGSSLVYLATHGSTEHVWSDVNDHNLSWPTVPPPTTPTFIYPVEMGSGTGDVVLDHRITANGSGLPPLNSTCIPPTNLAVIMACDTGSSNAFADGFLYPYANVYSPWSPIPENQAFLGFGYKVRLAHYGELASVLFEGLADGLVVHQARMRVWQQFAGRDGIPEDYEDFLPVWGDPFARIKGVYTVDETYVGWFDAS